MSMKGEPCIYPGKEIARHVSQENTRVCFLASNWEAHVGFRVRMDPACLSRNWLSNFLVNSESWGVPVGKRATPVCGNGAKTTPRFPVQDAIQMQKAWETVVLTRKHSPVDNTSTHSTQPRGRTKQGHAVTRLNCAPKKTGCTPKPQYLWLWPFLEKGSFQM